MTVWVLAAVLVLASRGATIPGRPMNAVAVGPVTIIPAQPGGLDADGDYVYPPAHPCGGFFPRSPDRHPAAAARRAARGLPTPVAPTPDPSAAARQRQCRKATKRAAAAP